jgi:transposase-like protein
MGADPTHLKARLEGFCCDPRFAETPVKADVIRRRVTMKTQTTASGGVGLGRGGRMSRQRKCDAVLRLLRGEDLEILSRALGVTAATLSGWQDTFLSAGESSLATRSTDGEALETERLKAKLGEMLLERELLDAKIAALEANRPLARRRSRR